MKTICFIAGTRPEIIKIAPVILEIRKTAADCLRAVLCLTGQHKTMAEQALDIFGLIPDANLGIMSENQSLNRVSSKIFALLPAQLEEVGPDLVIIQGDTTTAAMSALVSFQMRIPVAHIEAGLRTFDLSAPFPEEMNRRVITASCSVHFAPTSSARDNLLKENCRSENIVITGNTVVDALEIIQSQHDLDGIFRERFKIKKPYVLITAHRRENFGQGLKNICMGIRDAAARHAETSFVYPVHMNPNVAKPVRQILAGLENVFVLDPLPYLDLLVLLKNSEFCMTDSGGIQEEAPSFHKYVIVLRDHTERIESLQAGISELVGSSRERIVEAVERKLRSGGETDSGLRNPFGEGEAAKIIVDTIRSRLIHD